MKNIFLIAITVLMVVSCMKTKQRLFHHKNWKNIQGTWDIDDAWEDGISIVNVIKGDTCELYALTVIRYQNDRERDGMLHIYDNRNNDDYGFLGLEKENYKKMQICGFNFNITSAAIPKSPCYLNIGRTKCIKWNIEELSSKILIINSIYDNKSYRIKYIKL